MLLRAITAITLAGAILAAPATAADLVEPLKACYASDGPATDERETIRVHATGFTPKAPLDLRIDDVFEDSVLADAFGDARAEVAAPFQGRGERTFTLVIAEPGNPANLVSKVSKVTNLAVTLRPNPARPSQKVRFRGRGFTNPAPVFAHYVFAGVLQRTVRLARQPTGDCGVFSVRRRQIPVRNARVGDWRLQVDQQRKWVELPDSNMQAVMIRVRRTFLEP